MYSGAMRTITLSEEEYRFILEIIDMFLALQAAVFKDVVPPPDVSTALKRKLEEAAKK